MRRQGNDEGDSPRKSWSEIDKMKDKGFNRQRRQESRSQEKLQRSPVYEQYRSKASKMFSGSELPDALREKLDPSGALQARDDLLKKIKKLATDDRKQWSEKVLEFTEKFELPEDLFLISDWLDHPRDRVVDKALSKLESLVESGAWDGVKRPKSLDQRLRSLEMLSGDSEIQGRAKALRLKLY